MDRWILLKCCQALRRRDSRDPPGSGWGMVRAQRGGVVATHCCSVDEECVAVKLRHNVAL